MRSRWTWPDGDTILLLVVGLVLLAWAIGLPQGAALIVGGIGTVLLLGGVLLWREHPLGHWIAGTAFFLLLLGALYRLVIQGFSIRPCLGALFSAWGVWEHFFAWRQSPSLEEPARLAGEPPRETGSHLAYDERLMLSREKLSLSEEERQARERWPEFVQAFETRTPAATFAVKAQIREEDQVEALWLKVERLEGDRIFGTLDGDPTLLRRIRRWDRVQVELDDLVDWLYSEGDAIYGGFSAR